MDSLELLDQASASSPPSEPSDRQENPEFYCTGGYHPVKIGDTCHTRYTVVRKLGWGFFSTVWLCNDVQESRLVALKIMRSAPKFAQTAALEIDLLNHTLECDPDGRHKGKIVRLLDTFRICGVNGVHECMVFEVLGDDLYKLIQRSGKKGLPLADVKTIARNLFEAVHFLHNVCDIIHTDIKPENVCVTEDLSVTLADLGNACCIFCHYTDNIQTRPYRCPEVILRAGYTTKADIWSIACLVFELATGNLLFRPRFGANYGRSDNHLALMIGLLGDVPKEAVLGRKNFSKYFSEDCKLFHFPEIEFCGLCKVLTSKYQWGVDEASEFADFLLPMLAFDPNDRASARDSLRHKWLRV